MRNSHICNSIRERHDEMGREGCHSQRGIGYGLTRFYWVSQFAAEETDFLVLCSNRANPLGRERLVIGAV
jgi:hypothetical protein